MQNQLNIGEMLIHKFGSIVELFLISLTFGSGYLLLLTGPLTLLVLVFLIGAIIFDTSRTKPFPTLDLALLFVPAIFSLLIIGTNSIKANLVNGATPEQAAIIQNSFQAPLTVLIVFYACIGAALIHQCSTIRTSIVAALLMLSYYTACAYEFTEIAYCQLPPTMHL